jgi:hypothetical protein
MGVSTVNFQPIMVGALEDVTTHDEKLLTAGVSARSGSAVDTDQPNASPIEIICPREKGFGFIS